MVARPQPRGGHIPGLSPGRGTVAHHQPGTGLENRRLFQGFLRHRVHVRLGRGPLHIGPRDLGHRRIFGLLTAIQAPAATKRCQHPQQAEPPNTLYYFHPFIRIS